MPYKTLYDNFIVAALVMPFTDVSYNKLIHSATDLASPFSTAQMPRRIFALLPNIFVH